MSAIKDMLHEQIETILLEKKSLIAAFMAAHPDVDPVDIRFCQRLVVDDGEILQAEYWVDLPKKRYSVMADGWY